MNSNEILDLTIVALRQGHTQEAYDILMNNRDSYIKDPILYYYSFHLACQLKKVEDAISFFNEAVITLGMWYNTDFLDSDIHLDLIRDLDDYKHIYSVCKQRQIDLRFSGEKMIDIFVPETSTNKLFLMIPGNFQSLNDVKKSFNKDAIKDHIIAIPQAREFHSYAKPIWGDLTFGLNVVLEHYNEVVKEYDINKNAVIISSFAGGGNVIFKALVENAIPANNFIFFAPGIANLESFEPQIKALKEQYIKIFIVCGENDPHYLPFSNQFDELLTKYDVDHKYVILSDLDHSFPINNEEIITQAIMYFNGSN